MLFDSLFVHVVNSITNYLLYIIILHRFENIRVQFNSPVWNYQTSSSTGSLRLDQWTSEPIASPVWSPVRSSESRGIRSLIRNDRALGSPGSIFLAGMTLFSYTAKWQLTWLNHEFQLPGRCNVVVLRCTGVSRLLSQSWSWPLHGQIVPVARESGYRGSMER